MFAEQRVIVKTKIKEEKTIKELFKPVIDFADKNDLPFKIGWTDNNELIYDVQAEGKTSAYCKGMVAEVKQMVKEIFNCKLEVILYAY